MSLDLLHARVAFRDRPVVDVLDLALRFIVAHGRLYAVVAVSTLAPACLLSIAIAKELGWVTGWCFAVALGALAQTPFTVLASRLVFEEHVRAGEVLRHALKCSPSIVGARIVVAAGIAVGGAFCALPGLWVTAVLYFLTEVMLLERASLGIALSRAQKLTTASTGDVALALLLIVVAIVSSTFLADIAGRTLIEEILQFAPPKPLWETGDGALGFAGFFVAMPFAATARFFTYLNVRTRAEGWDIQTRFAAIAARESES